MRYAAALFTNIIRQMKTMLRSGLGKSSFSYLYSSLIIRTMANMTTMATVAASVIVLVVSQTRVHAGDMNIGPFVHAGAGVNTTVAQGWKTGPAFSGMPDIGVAAQYGLNPAGSLRVGLDLGYSALAFESQRVSTNQRIRERYNYLSLFPHLYYQSFVVGVSYNMPLSGQCTDIDNDLDVSTVINGSKIFEDYLASIPCLKTGVRITLATNNNNTLNLDVMVSYALSGLFADGKNYVGAYDYNGVNLVYNSAKNASPADIHLGFSYLFGL